MEILWDNFRETLTIAGATFKGGNVLYHYIFTSPLISQITRTVRIHLHGKIKQNIKTTTYKFILITDIY